jgi:hypothetical protein
MEPEKPVAENNEPEPDREIPEETLDKISAGATNNKGNIYIQSF